MKEREEKRYQDSSLPCLCLLLTAVVEMRPHSIVLKEACVRVCVCVCVCDRDRGEKERERKKKERMRE